MTQDEIRIGVKTHSLVAYRSFAKVKELQQMCLHPNKIRTPLRYNCPDCMKRWDIDSGIEWKPDWKPGEEYDCMRQLEE